ncbi:phosphatidate cytidylyltransferase, partial [Neisseria sp. P0001.S002]
LLGAFWFGKIGYFVLFFLISFAALLEFMTLVYRRRSDYYSMLVCFYLLLPVQYYFVYEGWYGMFRIFIPVYGFLIL